MPATDTLVRHPVQLRTTREHLLEDRERFSAGILDLASFRSGWKPQIDPVEVCTSSLVDDGVRIPAVYAVTDPRLFTEPVVTRTGLRDAAFGYRRRILREVRRQHNQQLNAGVNQLQRILQFGDIGSSSGLTGYAATGSATAPTATTWTATGTPFPTGASGAGNTGLQGKLFFVANALSSSAFTNPVVGVIVSNTSSVITVDQWYSLPMTGAAGTTPSANSAGFVLPGASLAAWVALATDTTTPAAADVTRSADGLWGNGTSGGTATETTTNGLARAWCGQGGGTAPTFPATLEYQFQNTWTYTGSSAVVIAKVVLFNSKAAAGTIAVLDTLLNATATVASNGDTCAVTWTITL